MSFVAVDEIVRQSGLSPPLVQSVLLEYELAGRLAQEAAIAVTGTVQTHPKTGAAQLAPVHVLRRALLGESSRSGL